MISRVAIALLVVIVGTSCAVFAETYYLRDTVGESCGAGTDEKDLSETAGSTNRTHDLVATQSWNIIPGAGSFASGTWTNNVWVQTGTGGGGPNRVTCTVRRMNTSCVEQQVIVSAASANLSAGTSCGTDADNIGTTGTPGLVTFASDDILLVECVRSNGGRTQEACYDGASGDYNSNLSTPTFTAAGARRVIIP
jgi:hypothetical protein